MPAPRGRAQWAPQGTRIRLGVGPQQGEPEPKPKETRESEGPVRARTRANGGHRSPSSKGGPCREGLQEGTMTAATTAEAMSPGLLKVRERAERDPEGVLLALAHLIDEEAL